MGMMSLITNQRTPGPAGSSPAPGAEITASMKMSFPALGYGACTSVWTVCVCVNTNIS